MILACVEGVGERTLTHLVATHGSARRALERARDGRLDPRCAVRGERPSRLPAQVVERIVEVARDPAPVLHTLAAAGVWTVTALDPDYPARLHDLADPPAVLFGTGDPAALRTPRAVALVGTRHPTPSGRVAASAIAAELAEAGAVVISGLALGIDGSAHAAVVERGRATVAVIGAGHDEPGPRAHRKLVRAIVAAGGAIVSELPPPAKATRGSFPRRNRLISGLADAVVVAEAPARSGALITAHLALEQGRPVFAVPGRRPGDVSAAGCTALLAEGDVRMFHGVRPLADLLGWETAACVAAIPLEASACPALGVGSCLSRQEATVIDVLRCGPTTASELVALTGLPAGVTAAVLTLLQLRGLVRVHGPLYLPAGALLSPFADAPRVGTAVLPSSQPDEAFACPADRLVG